MKRTDPFLFLAIAVSFALGTATNQVRASIPNLKTLQDTIYINCPSNNTILGDTTDNDPNFWKENYWYDAPNQVHDLSEVAVDLQITVSDSCFGATDNIQYQLYLDLDGNDTLETIINSENLGSAGLGWNKVLFGNAGIPNYTGVPRQFDERQVATNEKYGFALQITQTGQTRTAAVRWNTQADSNAYVLPQLPYGKHKIVWIVRDTCGNEQTCTSNFTIKDTGLPNVQCLSGLAFNFVSGGKIQLWASDFLLSLDDNCTPQNNLMIGIRNSGTGTGFPLDVIGNPQTGLTYYCPDIGIKNIELWVIDKAGNTNFCTSSVTVNDNFNNCNIDPTILRGQAATEANKGVENVAMHIEGSGYNLPPYSQFFKTNVSGFYNAYGVGGKQVIVTPYKNDNPLNGISTYDLVLLSKHILGVEALNSPYKIIAADVNKSNSVTSFDIVELRKLILGIDTAFHNNTSWRFVEKKYVFPNPLNPFQATFNEQITLPNYSGWENFQDFVAIKIGDLNGNAITSGSASATEARNAQTLWLSTENRAIKAGEIFTLHLTASEQVQAYQFTLNFQNLSLLDVQPRSKDMDLSNFGVFEQALTTSYNGEASGAFDLTFHAKADGNISDFLYLSDDITPSAAYLQDQRMAIDLQFKSPNAAVSEFEVYQNQPNPMETSTRIGVKTAREMSVKLEIFDLTGHLLHMQQSQFEKGYHAFTINRSDLPENTTGLLLYKIETEAGSITRKMMLLK